MRMIDSRGSSASRYPDVEVVVDNAVEHEGVTRLKTFTAYVEWDPESKLYVGIVPGIAGAHTQGASLDELRKNLEEVLALCLEEYQGSPDDLPRFVGVQQIEVAP